jgi:aminoglycoside phosphotransferase family enzyme/predicted kinase
VRRGGDGRATLVGGGEIIDWAVHMERLDDERRADHLLARAALSSSDIDAIATRIARFHASARYDADISRFGEPRAIRTNVEENFVQTKETIARYVSDDEARAIVRWQTAFLNDNEALFASRIEDGRVRDGHGDLRLEHVYVEGRGAERSEPTIASGGLGGEAPHAEHEITVLDCIEFNERFRFADVCADIAFLSMDLAGHGRVDLAERLLATYARESEDFDLYAVVDFYESYRAFVRAKIASIRAADSSLDAAARARAARDARRYFLLALSADRHSLLAPSVVAVGGIIASGKSTVAARVGASMSAPVIDADRTRKSMLGVAAHEHVEAAAWSGAYHPAFTERVYDEVFRRADVVLSSGRPVVLDASFRSAALRAKARALAEAHGLPFRFIECRVADDVCRARLARRERETGVSDARASLLDEFRARFEPVVELPERERVVVDTSRAFEETDAALEPMLDAWPPKLVG